MAVVKRAPERNALTGERLDPAGLVMRYTVPAHRTKPKYLEPEGDLIPAPLTLHRHPLHGGTARVGLAHSGRMNQFVGAIDDADKARHDREDKHWWLTTYGVRRVAARFTGMLGEQQAKHAMLALLAYYQRTDTSETIADIADRFQHSPGWLRGKIIKAAEFARS